MNNQKALIDNFLGEVVNELKNSPIVNTVAFVSNDSEPDFKILDDYLSESCGRKIKCINIKPDDEHLVGHVHFQYVPREGERKWTLEEAFKAGCIKADSKISMDLVEGRDFKRA